MGSGLWHRQAVDVPRWLGQWLWHQAAWGQTWAWCLCCDPGQGTDLLLPSVLMYWGLRPESLRGIVAPA